MIFIVALLFVVMCNSEQYIVESFDEIQNSTLLFELDSKYISLIDIESPMNNTYNYTKNKFIYVDSTENLEKFYPGLWGLDTIDRTNDNEYNYGRTGKGVVVYVVDSGVSDHDEFMNKNVSRLIGGASFTYGNADYHDCNGHGTHVASILGGNICGVAKDVKIVSVRVFDCSGIGRYSELLSALNWISKQKKGIINLSLTGVKYSLVNEIIDSMIIKGFVVVTAAGNNNDDACDYSPASANLAITVGCIEMGGASCLHSNEGRCVSLFAPGSGVLGANILGGYVTKTGTSMASPHVAGIAAQIKERFPRMKPAIIKKVILNNAVKDTLSLKMPNSPNLSARLLRG